MRGVGVQVPPHPAQRRIHTARADCLRLRHDRDISVYNMFSTWRAGASLHIVSDNRSDGPGQVHTGSTDHALVFRTLDCGFNAPYGLLKPGVFPSLRQTLFAEGLSSPRLRPHGCRQPCAHAKYQQFTPKQLDTARDQVLLEMENSVHH